MAFNPFHGFRKHQKVFFAILTIICMVTFILAFGQGDIFNWLVSKIGSGKSGEVVTELYGEKIYQSEVDMRNYLRRIANDFMSHGLAENVALAEQSIVEELQRPVAAKESDDTLRFRSALQTA